MKQCNLCRVKKALDKFYKHKTNKDGLQANCKRCSKKLRKKYKYPSIKSMHKKRFGGLRQQVLERDGHKCLECGMTRKEHQERWQRDLTLNHIDGQGRYSDEPNNTLENLETLCLSCHSKKDYRRHSSS